jgi:serine/threonine protein kinase
MSLIGRRIGNYEIKAKIGEGGMGTVYLGEHPLIGKRVAIKVLLEELVAKEEVVSRFFNEAKAVNDIGHLNIVDIVDFGKTLGERNEEVVYFIMEFLDGEALSARIRRAGLPFKDTMHIVGQCCSALAASHAKGIVHRDLKPENIFLIPRGADKNFVKILDFGIAKLTGDGGATSHKTRTGLVIGTPTYMSPEQCEGKGLIDHRSDVYSLGIVMYELLTGCVPFPGEGFGEVLVAHLTKQPARPSTVNANLPQSLEAIVLHAIEKDRNRRFQNMNEFLQAIENPDQHLQRWNALPDYTATPTVMAPSTKQNRTLSLDDVAPASQSSGQPRPTTLEGAASEVTLTPRRPRPRSRTPLVAAIAGALALVAVGGWLGLSKLKGGDKSSDETTASAVPVETPAPTPRPVPPPQAPTPAEPELVTVTVNSDPPGARVFRADRSEAESELTPITFKLKKGAPPFDIQLRRDGYLPQTRNITSDESVKMFVSLAKLPTAVAPPPPAPRHEETRVEPTVKPAKPAVAKKPKKAKKDAPADDDMTIIQPNF